MNRSSMKLSLLIIAALAAPAAFGQGWPLVAKQANTPVPCPATSNACSDKAGKLTSPWGDPIKTFIGRYLDSQSMREWQPGFRTARARVVAVVPERGRVFMIVGSALFGYNIDTFLSRLESGATMVPATVYGAANRGSYPETFLLPDEMFYAESAPNCIGVHDPIGCWVNDKTDGQDRLFGFDWDDRGYVYVAYNPYGWGIIKDNGVGLESQWQQTYESGIITPNRVLCVKSQGSYYVIASPDGGNLSNVFYVGNATTLAHERRTDIRHIIGGFAKNTSGDRIATVEGDGKVHIYSPDGIIAGIDAANFSAPAGNYYSIDTDGTNFYATSKATGTNGNLSIFTYNGSGYTRTDIDLGRPYDDSPRVHWGTGGWILIYGTEGYVPGTDSAAARNLRLYKLSGTSISPVPALVGAAQPAGGNSRQYFANYYHLNGAPNYTSPQFTGLDGASNPSVDARIFKQGSRTYLIIAAGGLGDVYELTSGDTVAAKVTQVGRASNPRAAGFALPGPFYGDEITFNAASSSAAPPPVFWSFQGDASQYPGPTVPYQYKLDATGVATLNGSGAVSRTATATVDANVFDTTTVQIKKPQIRLGINGRPELLFTQPDISSSAPIVSSDQWIDASDGALESHFTDWNLDGTTSTKAPDQVVSVGGCGTHTLIFTTHYGPNNQQAVPPVMLLGATEAAYSINPYKYEVTPFTYSVNDPIKDPNNPANILFTATMRTTGISADLTAGSATPATYTWSLLDANGNPTGLTQTFSNGTSLSSVPAFSVPKSTFGSTAMKVRLKVDIAPAATACTAYASQTRIKPNLSGPSGTIVATGCLNLGGQCSLTFGTPNASWKYSWTASGPAGVPPASGDGTGFATWVPFFSAAGTYQINVTVENAIGIFTAIPITITLGQPVCKSAPTDGTTVAAYFGSACQSSFDTCKTGETLNFYAQAIGWTKDTCDTYAWDFGDPSSGANTSASSTPTHAYNNPGTYTVSLTLQGGLSTAHVTTLVHVGTSTPVPQPPVPQPPIPQPPAPPPSGCSTLNDSSVYLGFNGNVTGCTPTYGNCNPTEPISFNAYANAGYNLGCAIHNYSWNFGDPSSATNGSTDVNPVHFYAQPGTYTVTLTISNQSQIGHATIQVKIGNGGGGTTDPPPTTCPTLTTALVSPAYSSATPNCRPGGTCTAGESVAFHVDLIGAAAGCTITNYNWTFGNSDHSSNSATPTFTFGAPGDYPVSVSVTNAQTSTPVTVIFNVHVGSAVGNCPEMTNQNVYFGWYGEGSGCTPNNGDCKDTENVGFSVYGNGYNFGCAPHTFTWDYDDGSPTEVGQFVKHKFKSAGTFEVSCTITNTAGGSFTMTSKVRVAGENGVVPVPGARKRPARGPGH